MSADLSDPIDYDALAAAEARLRAAAPRPPRARDAALALGVPEAALLELRRRAGPAIPLRRPDAAEGFAALLAPFAGAGEVMALTRNDFCVHEKIGPLPAPEFSGAMGQTVGAIDLRIFSEHWAHAWAMEEEGPDGPRRSLQFFDAAGDAVFKLHMRPQTDPEAFRAVVAGAAAGDAPAPRFAPPAPAREDAPDGAIDHAALREAWAGLQHSHDFHRLLRAHGVGRAQAMRLVGADFAAPLPPEAVREALAGAASAQIPVMVFVANRGCVQIHSGPIRRVEPMGPWLNVLDPGFNLHLRADKVASAFLVRKPSLRGDVHSLELFAADGALIAQIFGERLAGETERDDWRALVRGLAAEDA